MADDSNIKDSQCHGVLLQVWYLLMTNKFLDELPISDYLRNTLYILKQTGRRFSHLTVSLYMEVVTLLLMK